MGCFLYFLYLSLYPQLDLNISNPEIQHELNNYKPTELIQDTGCEISAISPTKGVAKYLEYVEITGTGFTPGSTIINGASPKTLCIFEPSIRDHFVTVAEVISDTQVK